MTLGSSQINTLFHLVVKDQNISNIFFSCKKITLVLLPQKKSRTVLIICCCFCTVLCITSWAPCSPTYTEVFLLGVSILLALSQISLSVWSVAAVCFSVWAAVVSAVTEITISSFWLSQVQKKILQPPAPPFANPHWPDWPHFSPLVWIEEQKEELWASLMLHCCADLIILVRGRAGPGRENKIWRETHWVHCWCLFSRLLVCSSWFWPCFTDSPCQRDLPLSFSLIQKLHMKIQGGFLCYSAIEN